jgi:hypothetical protein
MKTMKTIDLSRHGANLQDLLRLARSGNLILRTPEGKEFLLAEISDFEGEVALVRENEELMRFLQRRSRSTRKYSVDEVREALGLR